MWGGRGTHALVCEGQNTALEKKNLKEQGKLFESFICAKNVKKCRNKILFGKQKVPLKLSGVCVCVNISLMCVCNVYVSHVEASPWTVCPFELIEPQEKAD